MTPVEVRPVRSTRERRIFLTFPWRIYRDDHLWVPPLIPELARRIDPTRGALLQRGEAEFYIAWRDEEPVGTIVEGETVGWFPAIPNLNEVFCQVNGLRRPWDYLKLWWLMRQGTKSLTIKSVLVRPDYWNTGVPVLLFDEMAKRALDKGYKWADMSLTSEDNPSTPLLAEHAGLELYKRYRVYRLMIVDMAPPNP